MRHLAITLMLTILLAIAVQAQAPAAPAAPSFPLAPPAGPQIYPTPLVDTNEGFVPIFNGTSLDGWDGDPRYWRVEDHEIVGEVTPATLLKQNNFLIWRGGSPANFELKAEFRITAQGNSGINYRSVEIPGTKVPDARLPGRHRRRQQVHRPELRGARPHLSRAARHHYLRGNRQEAGDHRLARLGRRPEGLHQDPATGTSIT